MSCQHTDLGHHWPVSKTPFNCDPLLMFTGCLNTITSHRRADNIAFTVLYSCPRDVVEARARISLLWLSLRYTNFMKCRCIHQLLLSALYIDQFKITFSGVLVGSGYMTDRYK